MCPRLRLEGLDLLTGVPVDDSELEVIASTHNPVLSLDKSSCSNRDIGEFECLDDRLGFVGPDVRMAIV